MISLCTSFDRLWRELCHGRWLRTIAARPRDRRLEQRLWVEVGPSLIRRVKQASCVVPRAAVRFGTMAKTNIGVLLANAGALIFDCDGTLIETAPIYAQAWASGFGLSGKGMSAEWYKARAGLSEHVLMDDFESQHGVVLDREATLAHMRETFLKQLASLREIAVVTGIARQNHGKRPMAVASGGPAAIVKPSLKAAGLASIFDTVVTFDDVGRAKPEPDLFLEAARRLGVTAEQCLVFEDSLQGIEAAKRAGMQFVDIAELDRAA